MRSLIFKLFVDFEFRVWTTPWGQARATSHMAKFFTTRFETNEVKSDFNDTSRGWDAFLKLDPEMKYCLVDTMVLLPMHHGDEDIIGYVKRNLNNAVLVLLDSIIYEAAHKMAALEGNGGAPNFNDFVTSLSDALESAGIKFKFVRLRADMWTRSQKMFKEEAHPGLSKSDYTLLLAAMKRQSMDVMTDDKALIGAINAKRGQDASGKIRKATATHNKRRGAIAWLIKKMLAKFMPNDTLPNWNSRLEHTEFFIGKTKVASVSHKNGTTSVDLLGVVKMPDKDLLILQHDLSMKIRKMFLEWKPGRSKGDSATGPARKKDWYGEHDGDDGLDEAQRKSVARKLKNKNVVDLNI